MTIINMTHIEENCFVKSIEELHGRYSRTNSNFAAKI
jgi:hypothetical protein